MIIIISIIINYISEKFVFSSISLICQHKHGHLLANIFLRTEKCRSTKGKDAQFLTAEYQGSTIKMLLVAAPQ